MRDLAALARNAVRLIRGGQVRFRLETFGLYFPHLPYETPIWQISPRVAFLLLRQLPAYSRWLAEMEEIGLAGPESWWRGRM